jgi:hypothetical protein
MQESLREQHRKRLRPRAYNFCLGGESRSLNVVRASTSQLTSESLEGDTTGRCQAYQAEDAIDAMCLGVSDIPSVRA